MNSIISSIAGLAVGALGTYVTFYIRGALARREQIAKSLADFYASAATVFYAARDREKTPELSKSELLYKLFDEHSELYRSAGSAAPPRT